MNWALKLLLAAAIAVAGAAPSHALQAGAARQEITPPIGAPLNGYGYRMGRGAVEVHDPLWARALYLEDDETAVFLVSVDLCVMNRELRERVLELAPAIVPPDHIILTATHNHSGTGGMSRNLIARSVSGPFRPDLLDFTAQGIVDAMTAAYDARVRATVGYGVTTQEVLTQNRRHEDGPIDTQLGVIRVDDSDGGALAIIASMAAHPTTVGEDYAFAVSADFPGYYYEAMESMATDGCVAMFLNGAEGNQQCGNPEGAEGWAHTESVGRLLAVRAKSLANNIVGREVTLRVASSTPELPRTLADRILPRTTFLQTLEIDDLLLTFFPGEPCVEIGLELRRQALRHGYRAQFSVSLANDHLMYFVPEDFYGHLHYEAGMNFYGPKIAPWFYDQFAALMSKAPAAEPAPVPQPPNATNFNGAPRVRLQGSFYDIGYQRGLAFRDEIRAAYETRVLDPVRRDELVPDTGLWTVLPGVIDHSGLALVRLAIGSRTLLNGLDTSLIDEIAGMADAVGLPFDAVWLLQVQPEFLNPGRMEGLYRSPFCTLLAVTGDRAGADRVLAGRTLDWPLDEQPAILQVDPDDGYAYVQVGFQWNTGVFTGMNERGLALSIERVAPAGQPSFDAPAIELLLRECLLRDATVDAAQARLAQFPALRGYHVLLADESGDAAVIELGAEPVIRAPQEGLLLGVFPGSAHADDHARHRYARARALLSDERIVSVDELEAVLADAEPGLRGRQRILNADTRHAVVFSPTDRQLHVAFPDGAGKMGAFETLTVTGSGQ